MLQRPASAWPIAATSLARWRSHARTAAASVLWAEKTSAQRRKGSAPGRWRTTFHGRGDEEREGPDLARATVRSARSRRAPSTLSSESPEDLSLDPPKMSVNATGKKAGEPSG